MNMFFFTTSADLHLQRLRCIKQMNKKTVRISHDLGPVGKTQLFTNSFENCHTCLIMWHVVFPFTPLSSSSSSSRSGRERGRGGGSSGSVIGGGVRGSVSRRGRAKSSRSHCIHSLNRSNSSTRRRTTTTSSSYRCSLCPSE